MHQQQALGTTALSKPLERAIGTAKAVAIVAYPQRSVPLLAQQRGKMRAVDSDRHQSPLPGLIHPALTLFAPALQGVMHRLQRGILTVRQANDHQHPRRNGRGHGRLRLQLLVLLGLAAKPGLRPAPQAGRLIDLAHG